MISNNVMKTGEFDRAVYYKAACSCGSDDHIARIEFEYDKDFSYISLNFYTKVVWSSYWGDMNWFKRIWKRIKASIRILFTGYIELEESFMISSEDQIDALIEAFNEGKQKMVSKCKNTNSVKKK